MKRFAVILIIAVLALGCVFADTTPTTSKNVNNGDKFVVKTTINKIYPIYSITGKNESENVDGVHSSETAKEIEAIQNKNSTTGEVESVSINVSLKHFGYEKNDADAKKICAIRYTGKVSVTITADKLTNKVTTTGHVQNSEIPTSSDISYATATTDFKASKGTSTSSATNVVVVDADYITGKKVGGTTATEIATCKFTWDVTGLTAGDTYKANVTVTYTVQ